MPNIATSSLPSPSNRVDSDGNCAGVQIERTAEVNVELTLTQCSDMLASGPRR